MQIVDFALVLCGAVVLQDLVKEIGATHADEVAQLFGAVEYPEFFILLDDERLCTQKVGAKNKGQLVSCIDEQGGLVGVGISQKPENSCQQDKLHQQADTVEPHDRQYPVVELCHRKHPQRQNDAAYGVDRGVKRCIDAKDRANAEP